MFEVGACILYVEVGTCILYVTWTYAGTETAADADMANHPPHYNQHPAGIEAIDVIESNPFYNLAAAMKYLWRVSWGSKHNGIEDLEKAVWHTNREIARRKEAGNG